jgi:hypothetical protein
MELRHSQAGEKLNVITFYLLLLTRVSDPDLRIRMDPH